jgi:hypothetical protein
MKHVLQFGILAVILVGLGWKVFTLLNPEPEPVARVLMVGDPESDIQSIYGTPAGTSGKSGVTTYYFDALEIDAKDGAVVAIRDQKGITGSIEIGERKVVIDKANQIGER